MRDIVLLPIKFFVSLIVVLALGTCLQVLVDFSRLSIDDQRSVTDAITALVSRDFFYWIIPSIGLSWMFCAFSIMRRGKLKPIRLVFLILLLAGSFFAIFQFAPHPKTVAVGEQMEFQVPEKTVLSTPEAFFVVFPAVEGQDKLFLLHRTEHDARFRNLEKINYDNNTNELILASEGLTVSMDDVLGGRPALFTRPEFIEPGLNWCNQGLALFQKLGSKGLVSAAVLAGASALLLGSLWFFVRFTRWPLVNTVLAFFALCGAGILPALLMKREVLTLLAFIPGPYLDYLVPAVYTILALLFFGCSLFLPSLKEWQMGDEA